MRLLDHLNKFQCFVNVVETGSISHGSAKSFISQPQMSKIIQQLEDVLAAKLFVRSKSGVKTTKAGETLYKHALNVLEATNTIDLEIRNQDEIRKGEIRIGTYDSIGRYFFPDFLRYLKKVHPRLKVSMETNKSQMIYNNLEKGQLDIAIIIDAAKKRDLIVDPIYSDWFQLYSSAKPAFDCSNRIIYYSGLTEQFEGILSKRQFNETIECDNIETVKSLTEEGLGIGILPTRVARDGILSGKLQTEFSILKNISFLEHSIDLCTKRSTNNSLVDYFKNEVKRYLEVWSKA